MTSFAPLFEPTELDIILLQGARYRLVVSIECDWESDLSGWNPRMQLRASRAAAAPLVADLSGYLTVLGLPANQVIVDIDGNATELYAPKFLRGAYDIYVSPVDPARALRVLQGNWTLNTEVSQ